MNLNQALEQLPKSREETLAPETILSMENVAHARISFGPDRLAGVCIQRLIAHIRYLEAQTTRMGVCGRHLKQYEVREEHPDRQHGDADHVAVTRYCTLCVNELLRAEIEQLRLAAKGTK